MTQTQVAPPEGASVARRAAAMSGIRRSLPVAPAAVVVVGVVCALASAQGGYFPTSWGWASTSLLTAVGVWAIWSGRTEIGRPEITFVGLFALFAAWTGLSTAWSQVPASSVLELERALVPLSCVLAFLVLARRSHFEWLTLALVLSVAAVGGYALSTRLFPDRLGAFDPFAVYRLSDPIGYWNGLGILCVTGLLAALAMVTGAASIWARVASGASTVILATTLYFTYSRASWVALGVGLAFTITVSPRRLATLTTTAALVLPAGLAVLVASRSSALTHRESVLPAAVDEGRRLAVLVVALALLSAALVLLLGVAARRVTLPARLTRAVGLAGWLAVPVVLVVLVVRFGTPVDMAQRTWDAFERPPAKSSTELTDLNSRLFTFSGNGRAELWRAAWSIASDHPVAGAGAGTFERFWQARIHTPGLKVRDAHGLYVETLAELGVIGLALLVGALAVPLVVAIAGRRMPVVPALGGAYVAFLVHAGVDWDWELTGVTATGLVAGCLLLLSSRTRSIRTVGTPVRAGILTVVLVAGVAGMLGLVGNSAVAHGRSDLRRGQPVPAIEQADRAHRLMPWSPEPWLVRGEAQLLAGNSRAAVESFRKAIGADPGDWRGWHDLAVASTGRDRARALRHALSLYPQSPEIRNTIEVLRSSAR